jgi:hypothetical protein
MRRRKLLVALAGLAVVVAAGAVVLWPASASRISQANYALIPESLGRGPTMNRAQVEAILGPPGDYRTSPTLCQVPSYWLNTPTTNFTTLLLWEGDSAIICVHFTPSGFVFSKDLLENKLAESSPIETVLWRVRRQWHRWVPGKPAPPPPPPPTRLPTIAPDILWDSAKPD